MKGIPSKHLETRGIEVGESQELTGEISAFVEFYRSMSDEELRDEQEALEGERRELQEKKYTVSTPPIEEQDWSKDLSLTNKDIQTHDQINESLDLIQIKISAIQELLFK